MISPAMSPTKRHKTQIDPAGRLELTPGFGQRFGLLPGEQVILEERGREILLHRPVTFLERVYFILNQLITERTLVINPNTLESC